MKTAIVIGATGLVGSALVRLLIKETQFNKIIVFTRRALSIHHEKLQEHIIDFNTPQTWQHLVKGDVLLSTLGTTLKQAGSKKAQFQIDYTFQLDFAQAASANGVPVYVLVSSASANPDSKLFYTRMKGELEREIKKLTFQSISILQPSLLHGKRQAERIGEKISFGLVNLFNAIGLFKKYRPIHADIVASAMINTASKAEQGVHTYSLNKIFSLAGEMRERGLTD